MTVLGALAAFVMAVLVMRRIATILIVCAAALTGAYWTIGTLGLVGERITLLTTVLPMLAMIVGLTDAVHLAVDIRQSRSRGMSPVKATREALHHLLFACLLTSITTAVGFAALTVTSTEIVRRFGYACAAGAVLTFLSVITVLPLLASTRLGRGVLPPRGSQFLEASISRAATRIVASVLQFRWPITIAGLVLALLLAGTVTRLRPENDIAENLPHDAKSSVALRMVDEHFGGILPVFVCVDWPAHFDVDSPE